MIRTSVASAESSMHMAIAMDAKPCNLHLSNKLEETGPCIDFPPMLLPTEA